MTSKYTNKNGVKLLAVIMAFAMVFVAGFAIIGNNDADASNYHNKDNNTATNLLDLTGTVSLAGVTWNDGENTLAITDDVTVGGIYNDSALTITIAQGKTLTINAIGYGIYATGAIIINGPGAFAITVTENPSKSTGDYELNSYGIVGASVTIGTTTGLADSTINVDATSSEAKGKYSVGLNVHTSNGAITVKDTKLDIYAGNRGIDTDGAITFSGTSVITIGAYEKAIRSYDSDGVALNDTSTVYAKLIDGYGINDAGQNDRFGIKADTITVATGATLVTDGLRYTNSTAITTAWSGKVIVSGGYDQQCGVVKNIAGLYFDKKVTAVEAFVGTTATAEKGKITVTSDAQAFNIAINGKSSIVTPTITATTNGDLKTQVEGAITQATSTKSEIQIDLSGVNTGSNMTLVLDDLKGNNVTLILPSAVTYIKDVQVNLKGTESISLTGVDTATYTFNHMTSESTTPVASVAITSNGGFITVTPGSVNIDIQGAAGLSITGEGKVTGTVTGTTTISTTSGVTTPADVDITGIRIASGGTLKLTNVNVKSTEYILNQGTIYFDDTSVANVPTIDGSVFINGGSVKGTIDNGNLVVKGTVSIPAATEITNDAKINVSKGATLSITTNITLTNKGTINLSGIIDNDNVDDPDTPTTYSKLDNRGKIVMLDKDASIASFGSNFYTGSGIIDSSSIASDVQISGDIETVTEYGLYQTVTIIGNVNLLKGSQITIKGALVINEGVTVTIEDGAQLIIDGPAATMENNGTIIVESDIASGAALKEGTTSVAGGLVLSNNSISTNNGAITLSYALLAGESGNKVSMTVSAELNNNGTIVVGEDNKMDNSVAVNNKTDGIITVNGEITDVNNAGSVVIDGKARTINNIADGATVSVISTKANLEINDTNFKYGKTSVAGTNSITITKNDADSIGTFTVVSEVTKKTNNDGTVTYGKKFIVAGTFSEAFTAASGDHASVALAGTVNVADELTLSDNINMTGGTLSVSGTVTAKVGTQIGVSTLTVTGEVIVGSSAVSASTINAAMYKVVVINPASTTFYYTTLDKAIAGSVEASVTEVTATGDVSVKANIEVPAGMTVKQTSGKITVGSSTATDVTMTVAQNGKIAQTAGATIDVKGTLYIVDKKTGINKGATVTCEVISEGATDLRYTNLNSAIAAAGSDEVTITLNGETKITTDSVIPENVTIDMNGNKFAVEGAKLTINGVLYVDIVSNYTVSDVSGTVDRIGKVVLNGYIVSDDPISYNATTAKSPAGVYYIADSMNIITSIENIDEAVSDADDSVVAVNGEITTGDLTVTGTSNEPVTVNVNGKLTAGKITLDFATIVLKQNIEVTATIAGANGSIALTDIKTVNDTKFVANENSDKVKVITVDSGSIDKISTEKAKTYAVVMDGDVIVKAITLAAIEDAANKYYSLTVDGNVKVTGSSNDLKNVLVNGTLTADNAVTINATNIDVIGNLVAEKATETKTAGSIAVSKTLVVGSTYKAMTTGAVASATGNITYTTLLVLDGATVDETIITDMKSTTFYVEGAVWMIGYTANPADSNNVSINDINIIPIEDAYFGGTWMIDLSNNESTVGAGAKIGSISAVYALIKYDIYKVEVVADNGIGTISIDGVVLIKNAGSGENVFILPGNTQLKAGAHQITYTVKDGYGGTVKILVDGTAISGNSFTLSGTEGIVSPGTVNVSINVSGTTPVTPDTPAPTPTPVEPSEKDDSMGITEYLLIVLVILAAILVVVVAIRMMRS